MPRKTFYGYTPIASGSQAILERPRINSVLEKAVQKPVVNVVAGAGYGKTQAVYTFAKKSNIRTAWIQISERDNLRENFLNSFLSAASFMAGKQFKGCLKDLWKSFISSEKILFVYDDLHLVTNKDVLYLLERCVTAPFPNITSILISRTEPPAGFAIPFLNTAELKPRKLLAGITEDELRFRQNEMVSYFRLQGLSPPPETASAIYQDTEGWPFAIHLASLSLKNAEGNFARPVNGSQTPYAFTRGAAYVKQALRSNAFKLFESEIMAGLSPQFRSFLVKLSLLENPDKYLLPETGMNDSIAKELKKTGSFIRFNKKTNSYRVHHLFMDYLRKLQNELSEKEKKELWARAAFRAVANNKEMDAIVYFEKTGNYSGIVDIFNTLPLIVASPMAGFILELLDRTPETVYRDYPLLITIRARILMSLGRYEQGRKELLEMLPVFTGLPDTADKHRVLAACYMGLAFFVLLESAYTRQYDFRHFLEIAVAESRQSKHIVKAPLNGMIVGFHACRVIDPSPKEMERYIAAASEMAPYAMEVMGGCQAGLYELLQGELAFYKGDPENAKERLFEALPKSREREQYEIENRALFYLLRIHLSQGDVKGITRVLEQLEENLKEPLYPNRHFQNDIVLGWYYIQTGRKDRIAPWLKSDYEERGLNSHVYGLEKLLKAKYYLEEKRYPAALASLEKHGNMEIFIMGGIEMKTLEAVCRYHLSDREGAFKILKEAYDLAFPAGLFMPFTELGKDMRALTEAAIKAEVPTIPRKWLQETRRKAAIYAKKLYRLPGYRDDKTLSHREKEILVGLSQGLTREEIAGAGSISPNTVKSATRSIYNKLGALNHADAVRIATERGILPMEA